ncbi:MAG: hypothetical protein BWK78_05460 [Thiotrichaceae bacterium IS1]|nr:MAG: hypothetical protein BWK78_05460 [Thiotrichaceae bacterium IS1]
MKPMFKKTALTLALTTALTINTPVWADLNAADYAPSPDETLDLKLNDGSIAKTCTFADMSTSAFNKYVNALCSAAIVIGYSESGKRVYKPDQFATLAELLKVVHFTNNYDDTVARCVATKNSANWYQCHLDFAKTQGVWDSGSLVYPNGSPLRGEAMRYATKLYFGQSFVKPLDAANFLAQRGIINPQSNEAGYRLFDKITRGEMAKIAVHAAAVAGKKVPYGIVDYPPAAAADIPTSTVPTTATGSTLGQQIVNKAKTQVGSKKSPWVDRINTYCLRFVRMMFSKPATYPSAFGLCQAFQNAGKLRVGPVAGGAVCYSKSAGNKNQGHIAIATGTGTEIGVTSLAYGVTEKPVMSQGYYMGTISPEDFVTYYPR